jgi:hypothetical protein
MSAFEKDARRALIASNPCLHCLHYTSREFWDIRAVIPLSVLTGMGGRLYFAGGLSLLLCLWEADMKKRYFRSLLAALISLFLGACAVLDISTLDTAVPLRKGQMEAGVLSGFGLDVARSVGPGNQVAIDGVWGLHANYGIDGKSEAGLRAWTFTNGGVGLRGNFKHNFYNKGKKYASVIPGIAAIWHGPEMRPDQLACIATEVQAVGTYRFNGYISATAGARANLDYVAQYMDTDHDWQQGTYYIWHGGIRANMEFFGGKYFPLALIPEIGVELVKPSSGDIKVMPTVGLSLTGRFGLLKSR